MRRASSSVTSSAPIPPGPNSPLCPGTASALRCMAWKSTGKCPAVCAPSNAKGTPRAAQIRPMVSASCTVPLTLEPWAMSTSLVFSRNSPSSASNSAKPSPSQGIRLTSTPGRRSSGRITALCSMLLTMQ